MSMRLDLTNLRVMKTGNYREPVYGAWPPAYRELEPPMWYVLFYKPKQTWLITDDMEKAGLNAAGADVDIVGYGTNIDSAFFIVWTHQKEVGAARTILDDFRDAQRRKIEADDNEWDWDPKPEKRLERVYSPFDRLEIPNIMGMIFGQQMFGQQAAAQEEEEKDDGDGES